jgi:hypothetical protein
MIEDVKVTILIPTAYDSRYIIELCLESIKKYTNYPYKIIVGDNGCDDCARKFLEGQTDINLVDVPQINRKNPKDFLAALVKTKYYLILHDDIQILSKNWLSNRIKTMERDSSNAIVGEAVPNYHNGLRGKIKSLFKKGYRRFLPLGLLIKTEVSEELNLKWGKVGNKLDTGGYAYQQFSVQRKYKFVRYPIKNEIRHFGAMSWPIRKIINNDNTALDLNNLLKQRKEKIELIKLILKENRY